MKRRIKFISLMLCLSLVIGIVGSIFVINRERHHHCTGQGCAICFHIHQIKQTTEHVELVGSLTSCGLLVLCFVLGIIYFIDFLRRQKTLVAMKVELLD